MKEILGLLLCINCMLLWSPKLVAEDGDGSIKPDLKPGSRPKIPAKSQFAFYVDNDELVIESSSRDLAEITLVDVDSGTVVFSYSSILYPEFRCDITGLTGTFNLIVSYGGQTSSAIIIL